MRAALRCSGPRDTAYPVAAPPASPVRTLLRVLHVVATPQPLLTPAVRAVDLLSKPEVARSGRVRQVERALQAALTLAVTAHPDPDAVLSHAVTACSRQPTPVLQASAVAPLVGSTTSLIKYPPAIRANINNTCINFI